VSDFWLKRLVIRDHRRDVVLGRIPSLEGKHIFDGPYDSADEAMRHVYASNALMDFTSELVNELPPQ
jgi:hypothetical protein